MSNAAAARSGLALTAWMRPLPPSQSRTIAPLSRVSWVPKVLETKIAAVRAGSSGASTRCAAAPSTLEMKCTPKRPGRGPPSASATSRGPRSEPPMPTLTISVTSLASSASISVRMRNRTSAALR